MEVICKEEKMVNGEACPPVHNEFVILDSDLYFDKQKQEDGPVRLKPPTRLGFGKGKELRTAIKFLKPSQEDLQWILPMLSSVETQSHAKDHVDKNMIKTKESKVVKQDDVVVSKMSNQKKQHQEGSLISHNKEVARLDEASYEERLERSKRKLQVSYQHIYNAKKLRMTRLIEPQNLVPANPIIRPKAMVGKKMSFLKSGKPCKFRPATAF